MINRERIRFIADNISEWNVDRIARDREWVCEICSNLNCPSIYKYEKLDRSGKIEDRAWLCEDCKTELDRTVSGYYVKEIKDAVKRLVSLAKKY